MSHVTILGGSSFVAPFLRDRLHAGDWHGCMVSRGGKIKTGDFADIRLDLTGSDPWQAGEDSLVISLIPLWITAGALPRLTAARQLIALGSTSVVGKARSHDPHEQNVVRKLAESEDKLKVWGQAHNVPVTILRPTMIYDGRHDENITRIARFAHKFGFFPLCGKAQGLRQPIHADDVAQACVRAMDNPKAANATFNIAGGECLPYRAMVARIFAALNRSPHFLPVPAFAVKSLAPLVRRAGQGGTAEMLLRMNEDLVYPFQDGLDALHYTPRPFLPIFPFSPEA